MIIAHRMLKLRHAARIVEIPIEMSLPERTHDGSWFCRYSIGWPDGVWQARAGGADSVQAVVLALQMIGSEIHTSNHHKSGRLFVDAPGGGYGFPVPVTLRDLLEGDDRKFF